MISGPARPKLVTSIKTQASSGIWGSGCHRNQTRAVCWGWVRISSKQRDNTRCRWFLLKLLFTSSLKQIEIIKSRRLISCPKPVSLLFISHLFLSPNYFFPFCSLSSLITGTTGDERWSHETSHHWETCDLDDHHLLRVVQDDLRPSPHWPSVHVCPWPIAQPLIHRSGPGLGWITSEVMWLWKCSLCNLQKLQQSWVCVLIG